MQRREDAKESKSTDLDRASAEELSRPEGADLSSEGGPGLDGDARASDEVDPESDDEVETLTALSQLDAEAAVGYQVAIDECDVQDLRDTLEGFRADHLRHVQDLNECVRRLGGEPVDGVPDPDDSALVRFIEAVGPLGTRALLLAMIANEQLTNATYDTALEFVSEPEARKTVERNFDDEQRHIRTLTDLRDRDWDVEEARTAE